MSTGTVSIKFDERFRATSCAHENTNGPKTLSVVSVRHTRNTIWETSNLNGCATARSCLDKSRPLAFVCLALKIVSQIAS
jgi:hypothetical protein